MSSDSILPAQVTLRPRGQAVRLPQPAAKLARRFFPAQTSAALCKFLAELEAIESQTSICCVAHESGNDT